MKYLHWEFRATPGAVIEVELDKQANVLMLDSANYARYRRGTDHRYRGGLAKVSPCRLPVPHGGTWHVVVDLGGNTGRVAASAALLS